MYQKFKKSTCKPAQEAACKRQKHGVKKSEESAHLSPTYFRLTEDGPRISSVHVICKTIRNDQRRRPGPNKPASSSVTCGSCSYQEASMAFNPESNPGCPLVSQSMSGSVSPVTFEGTLVSAGVTPAEKQKLAPDTLKCHLIYLIGWHPTCESQMCK